MVPSLSSGAIKRMLNTEQLPHIILQVLGTKEILGFGSSVRYRLLISDGDMMCSFAMLGTQLNHMISNGQLEKFTVIRVDKYVCNNVTPEKQIVILLDIAVLSPGNEVGTRFGNPVAIDQLPMDTGPANALFKKSLNKSMGLIVLPSLSSGAFKRILKAEQLPNVIVQVLGTKKVQGFGSSDRYRLLISDGDMMCSFAMLGTQLNHMISNGELEKFTVIRVDKYVCNNVTPEKQIVILLNISVLSPGNEVGVKLGNPVAIDQLPMDTGPGNALFKKKSLNNSMGLTVFPSLSSGAIKRMLKAEQLPNIILQVLGTKKVQGFGSWDRYRLLISDGNTMCSFAMLGTQLNHMISNGQLEKFTVIRVDKYVCNNVTPEKQIVILLDIAVLSPGNEVGTRFGNPVPINQPPIDTDPSNALFKKEPLSDSVKLTVLPSSSFGAIERILNAFTYVAQW